MARTIRNRDQAGRKAYYRRMETGTSRRARRRKAWFDRLAQAVPQSHCQARTAHNTARPQ
jgi:hypothetical protein